MSEQTKRDADGIKKEFQDLTDTAETLKRQAEKRLKDGALIKKIEKVIETSKEVTKHIEEAQK